MNGASHWRDALARPDNGGNRSGRMRYEADESPNTTNNDGTINIYYDIVVYKHGGAFARCSLVSQQSQHKSYVQINQLSRHDSYAHTHTPTPETATRSRLCTLLCVLLRIC